MSYSSTEHTTGRRLWRLSIITAALLAAGHSTALELGTNSDDDDNPNNTALGDNAQSTGLFSVSVGLGSQATDPSTVAIGHSAFAIEPSSTALGSAAGAGSDASATALGRSAAANNLQSLSIGALSEARRDFTTSFGYRARTGGSVDVEGASAFGAYAEAWVSRGTAAGHRSRAGQIQATAFGQNARAIPLRSTAAGQGARSDENDGSALGKSARVSGLGATALGTRADAAGASAVALGFGAEATTASTVALGTAELRRRLTNMDDGIGEFDAINVGQLDAALLASNQLHRERMDQLYAATRRLESLLQATDAELLALQRALGNGQRHAQPASWSAYTR